MGGAGADGDAGTAVADALVISASLVAAAASLGSPSTGRLLRSIAAIIFSFQLPRFKLPLNPNADDDGDDAAESPPLAFFGVADGRFGLAGDVGAESPRGDIGGFVKSFSERVVVNAGRGDDTGTGDAALLASGADATGTEAVELPYPSLTMRDETTRSSGGDAGVTAMVGVFDSSRRPVRQPFM